MTKQTKPHQEEWEKEFDKNVNYDEAELGCNWSQDELKDFIRQAIQTEVKREGKNEFADFIQYKVYKNKKGSILEDGEKGNLPALLFSILHNQFLMMEKLKTLKGLAQRRKNELSTNC